MQDRMQKASPEFIAAEKEEVLLWEAEVERFQSLRPVEAARDQIRLEELPTLEGRIKKEEGVYPAIVRKAEEVSLLLTSVLK